MGDGSIYKRTDVYMGEAKPEPKHLFVKIADRIENHNRQNKTLNILDVGGASGDFVSYASERFPGSLISCVDADSELVELGRKKVPNVNFLLGDANNMPEIKSSSMDVVTMIGVMTIFDDFRTSLSECLRIVSHGGLVLVAGMFNEYPVDALVKWRYSGNSGPWHQGYNLFSKKTVSAFLQDQDVVESWSFEKFVMPFDLNPQTDPIRTWTEMDCNGNRVFKNGLQMEINIQILEITMKKTG